MSQTGPGDPVPVFQDRLEENKNRVAREPLCNCLL